MKIKGDHIKDNKKLLSGRLYKIKATRTIIFEEQETNDIVYIHFHIQNDQYGIYGNEYKPPFVEDEGGKRADLLILLIDENGKRFCSWVMDVKKAVGGEDVIYHLVEQLTESLKHKRAISTYLDGFEEEQHVGYITREVQRERIQEAISKKRFYLEREKEKIKNVPALIRVGASLELLKEEAKLKVLVAFQNDCIEIGTNRIQIEYYISEPCNNKFACHLNIFC